MADRHHKQPQHSLEPGTMCKMLSATHERGKYVAVALPGYANDEASGTKYCTVRTSSTVRNNSKQAGCYDVQVQETILNSERHLPVSQ